MLLTKLFFKYYKSRRLIISVVFILLGSSAGAAETNKTQQRSTVTEGRAAIEFYQLEKQQAEHSSRLSDKAIAYPASTVERLPPLLEIGDPFLGNGPISPGIETPTGQMLQPWFLLYGSYRTALQNFDLGHEQTAEWSNRLDLHGNLNLSGTERLLFSMRPLDDQQGSYSGYNFSPDENDGWQDALNLRLTQIFFEGEIGEIFPSLDPDDSATFDIGFSIGRQSFLAQDGILINEMIDMVGFTRNSLIFKGLPNLRVTGIYSWNGINRGRAHNDNSAQLFGLFSEADTSWGSTISLDLIYVDDKEQSNAWYIGAGSTQRLGIINSTFRINVSIPENNDTPSVSQGVLLSSELSHTFYDSDNLLYFNTFLSIDQFTSAGRSPDQGSPIANLGILYAPVGMGRYGIPLGQSIADTIGTAIGYQIFLDGISSQLIFEFGARVNTKHTEQEGVLGLGARYQRAIGKRHILRFDSFVASHEQHSPSYGVRSEWMIKF